MLTDDLRSQLQHTLGDDYQLEQELLGGMSRVFVASQRSLGRRVVVKVVPRALGPVNAERFRREILFAAQLNHPHIVGVLTAGESEGMGFYTMPFVEGESLRVRMAREGQLPIPTVIGVLHDVAEALAYAHARGVIHRDIKPENVLLVGNSAMLADFGIAKAFASDGGAASNGDTTAVTAAGAVVGTPKYMAPEQASGDHGADQRMDIYSLGLVGYEMLTGRMPFGGQTPQELLVSRFLRRPDPVTNYRSDVPPSLAALIMHCIATEPSARLGSADEILHELDALRSGDVAIAPTPLRAERPVGRSIAVLPFVNRSPGDENEYFSDGMTDELINALARANSLRVAARTSSFALKGTTEDVKSIGRRLEVDAILEGSVRRAGNRIRITAQLVDVSNGFQLWSNVYDRELTDVFDIQEEIARAIARALSTLSSSEVAAVAVPRVANMEAYDLYLKGRLHWHERSASRLESALQLFSQAATIEPSFAQAHAGIADAYAMLGQYGVMAPGDAFPMSKAAAQRALALDANLAEAHASLGFSLFFYDWDYAGAEQAFRRALELNPSYAFGHQWYGQLLGVMGRAEESIEESRRAVQLDPLSPVVNTNLGNALYLARRFDDAIRQCNRAIALEPRFFLPYFFLAQSLYGKGSFEEAESAARQGAELAPESPLAMTALGFILARNGKHGEARAILDEFLEQHRAGKPMAVYISMLEMGLGDIDKGILWQERAIEERSDKAVYLGTAAWVDLLRDHPKFPALLARVGLQSSRRAQ